MSELSAKTWKAAIYVRISKDNGEDTLENQESIVIKHLFKLHNVQLCSIHVDDGYSGLHSTRPAFQEMLSEIERGEINCVVVRDLSRFSRNHIDTGRYIQKIFPSLGVRFISVLDKMDFLTAPSRNDLLMLGIKSVFNEDYICNLSRNIQRTLRSGYAQGKYLGAYAPYGYVKSPLDKHRLEPDPQTEMVVKRIYRWKLEGMSIAAIAESWDNWGVPCPREYKKLITDAYQTGFQKNETAKWTPVAILRILSNKVYTGRLEQGKSQKLYFKAQRRTKTLQSQWVCTENAHEAIIDISQFEAVQRLLLMDARSSPGEKTVAVLSGFVRCKRCGKNMIQKQNCSKQKKYFYYICNGRNTENIPCPSQRISKPVLEKEVFWQIARRINDVMEIDKKLQRMDTSALHQLKKQQLTEEIEILTKELNLRRKCLDGLHDEIIIETHSLSELEKMQKRYLKECNRLEISIQKVEANMQVQSDAKELFGWIEQYKPYYNFKEITRPLLAYLVEKITVGQDKKVAVEFIHEREYRFLKNKLNIER